MKYLILIFLLAAISCLPEATKINDDLKCSLLGSEDSIALKVEAELGFSLPSNLTIKFNVNGSDLIVDECVGDSSIFIEQDRTAAAARFSLESNLEIHDYYFPNNSEVPVIESASFEVFKRSNCSAQLESVSLRPNNVVTWLPIFANGKDCDKTSHTGYSSFKLTP